MKSSRDLTPASDYEAWLREFDLRDLDAADPRTMWALKYRSRLHSALEPLRRLPTGARALEVGSSQANASLHAAERGLQAIALDREPRALGYALKKHTTGSFSAVCGDAVALPFASETMDAVLLPELLEHLPEPLQALAEARRVLRPKGLLIVTTPNATRSGETLPSYSEHDTRKQARPEADAAGHLFAFTLRELRELVAGAGFQPLHARYEGSAVMSDRLPLGRVLPPALTIALSHLFTRLPGAARWAYNCLLIARRKG
ncbi:MAG: class I SAM-dependent methyltransferase [Armatimonadia bacterium]